MTPKKLDEMSVDELGQFCDAAAARVLFGSPTTVCPKCAASKALETAQRRLAELGQPVPERHAAAYRSLEVVLDLFTRIRLVLCGRHAAELFRQQVEALEQPRGNRVFVSHEPGAATRAASARARPSQCPACLRHWNPSMDENESYPGSACDQGVCCEGRDGD